jgi:hypothetical protein
MVLTPQATGRMLLVLTPIGERQMTDRPYLTRQWLIDDARDAVLAALDAWATESGLNVDGWKDHELPTLFRGIDAHIDRVIDRSGIAMPDSPYPEEFIQRTKEALARARGQ